MNKSAYARITQLVEEGVTPHYSFEISVYSDHSFPSHYRHHLLKVLTNCPSLQIDVINGLHLLSAKPVTYLVNLSEKDFVRKKNKWLVENPSTHSSGDA